MNAQIYQKTVVDKCAILDPGAFILRRMNIRSDWTHVRIAAFISFTTAADDNAQHTTESLNIGLNPARNRWAFGLKNIVNLDAPQDEPIPLQAGSTFIGCSIRQNTGTCSLTATGLSGTYPCNLWFDGTTIPAELDNNNKNDVAIPADGSGSTSYARGWIVTIEKLGGGQVRVAYDSSAADITDVSATALLDFLNNGGESVTDVRNPTFEPGDGLFIRSPFLNNRMRVHAYGWLDLTPSV